MQIILWIVFGGIIGWIASIIMNTDNQQGLTLNVIVGILGSVVGGWLMGFLGYGGVNIFNLYGFLVSILGAVILIAIAKAIR